MRIPLLLALTLLGSAATGEEPTFDGKSLAEWEKQLDSADGGKRADAVYGLFGIAARAKPTDRTTLPVPTLKRLAVMLRDDPSEDCRNEISGVFTHFKMRRDLFAVPELHAALIASCEDKSVPVRTNAGTSLRYGPTTDKATAALARLLDDSDELVRGNAALAVAEHGAKSATSSKKVRAMMASGNSDRLRTQAARALWMLERDQTEVLHTLIDVWANSKEHFKWEMSASVAEVMGTAAKPFAPLIVHELQFLKGYAAEGDEDRKLYAAELRSSLLPVLQAIDPPSFIKELPDAPKPPDGFPKFKVQEIATKGVVNSELKIGYAVISVDIDGDKKPDIVVVDQHKVVWFQNPTWQRRVLLDGKTAPDNVCVTAADIDGDGLPELVVGAAWKPFDTAKAATLQWLKRGKTLDDEWTMHPIACDEPTVHRVRAIDLDGDGKPEIVMAPLMGKGATKEKNWMDGRPVRVVSYKIPAKNPEKAESWNAEVLSEDLHVVHNFAPFTPTGDKTPMSIVTASYEGYSAILFGKDGVKPKTKLVHAGNQTTPNGNRGASEIRVGYVKPVAERKDRADGAVVATIEPWHGNEVVVYTGIVGEKPTRTVLDDHLVWGHAVAFADLDGDGKDELVIGVRDNPPAKGKFTEKCGVRIYKQNGEKWDRYILEDGGVAVEDLITADLNGDGKPDIVAVGRATGNARIYWNQGK